MYIKKEKLGEGSYGSVYLLKHKLNNECVAAKFVDISEYMKKADDIQKALKEAQYMLTLDHKNIVKLESVFILNNQLIIFMEHIAGGELKQCISNKSTRFPEIDVKKIMKVLISAINYIHKHNIVHRDLKLENILLVNANDPFSIKIIDFGISGILSKVGGEVINAGTIMYSPPEVLSKKKM
jgi:serine/threonine protein kinase